MFPEKLDDIPIGERIFCNRSLNMASIKAVGFDMDYTLALYNHETFEKLAYDETLKKLVVIGYPKELLKWQFDHKYMVRGLVVDKKLGNILKMDRHRYVKLAYHGFRELTRDERRKLYELDKVISYEEPDFALIDTIFSLAEAFLFVQLVDFKENSNKLNEKSFIQLYQDVKKCIDLSHRDGSIKSKIAQNPDKYIKNDPYLMQVLKELKMSGRKLFIVTNSLWDYTNVVMGYLFVIQGIDKKKWTDYFDVVITGSQKPHFFMTKNPIYEIELETCLLRNIEVLPGSTIQVDLQMKESRANSSLNCNYLDENSDKVESNNNLTEKKYIPKVFQGGHVKLLHDMLNVQKGSEILYVGDHIYGDILRSKKEIGWRTMLVIEELEAEINNLYFLRDQYESCCSLSLKEELLGDELERIRIKFNGKKNSNDLQIDSDGIENYENEFKKISYDIKKIQEAEKKALLKYHQSFHSLWGELMKTGKQNSRFSAQVINYACLYTSKLSNLRHYGANKNFQAVRDFMPHDYDI